MAKSNSRSGKCSLWGFWSPKYWPAWMLLLWMRAVALLPFRPMVGLHRRIGRALGALSRRQAHVARCNLRLCFPELKSDEIERLVTRHFESLGICIGEMAFAWFGSPRKLRPLFRVDGFEHLEAALAEGKGVILFTGHFTPLEICGPMLKMVLPRFAFMFSRRRNPLLDEMQARRRVRVGHESFARDDVRAMLRSLRGNAAVWYAADQFDRGRTARLVTFFEEPAMTNTAISRLARISGAAVVPFFYRRCRDGSGYVLEFEPALADLPSADPVVDARRLFGRLERGIRPCPEQYLWTHKKFRGRPAPFPDVYARPPEGWSGRHGDAAPSN